MKNWIKTLTGLLAGSILLTTSSLAFAINADKVPEKKQTTASQYLTAVEANELITKDPKNILFLDIRTRAEVNFLGMPTIADANIPYFTPQEWSEWDKKKQNFPLSPNSNFLTAVEDRLKAKGLDKNSPVVLMCRSGSRSAKAANLMHDAGYKNVYTIVDGFEGDKAKEGAHKGQRVVNGWKNSNLPWSYKLDQEKMYFEI